MTMESQASSEMPKVTKPEIPSSSTRRSPRSKPSTTVTGAGNTSKSAAAVRKNISKVGETSSLNVNNIKQENVESNEEERPPEFERHFVKVEAGDDNIIDNDGEIDNSESGQFKQSIFIRCDSELKTKQARSKAKQSASVASSKPVGGAGKEVIDDWDEESITSVHSEESTEGQDEGTSDKSAKEALLQTSNLLKSIKSNLKRKKEPAKVATKKPKTSTNAGSSASSASKGGAKASSPALALPGLRNIIGSNFKKLNLTLNEPYDIKNEIGLSYKHEDPSVDSAASSQNADGSFECPKCGANFKWKTTLKFHMFNHLEDKALECNVCFKLFLSPAYLHEHKKVHLFENQDRNFNCQDCSGQFESEASLSTHRLSHAKLDTQHYVCNVCKARFASLFSLNSHKAKHSAAIKYECKPCDLRFKTLKTLTKHIATHNVEVKITENK